MEKQFQSLQALEQKGVSFHITIDNQFGLNEDCFLSADEIVNWLRNPQLWAAQHFRMEERQYLRWCERHGVPQCCAETKQGKRCKLNSVGGRMGMSASEFMELDGQYCSVHGGE